MAKEETDPNRLAYLAWVLGAEFDPLLKEAERLGEIVRERKGEMVGELRLGVLPTIAPYLLPLFLNSFLQQYPGIRLKVTELTTGALGNSYAPNFSC